MIRIAIHLLIIAACIVLLARELPVHEARQHPGVTFSAGSRP